MKYKKNIVLVATLLLILQLYNLYITRNAESERTASNVHDLTTSYAGFNTLILHGSIYCAFFLGIVVVNLSSTNTQILTRMKRTAFIRGKIILLAVISGCFVLCFTFIFIINLLRFYDYSFLEKLNVFYLFYWFIPLFISLYMVIAAIYLLFEVLFDDKMYSYFITLFASTLLVSLSVIYKFWTPFDNMDIFDQFFTGEFNTWSVSLKILQNLVIYTAITYITIQIFKMKDLIK